MQRDLEELLRELALGLLDDLYPGALAGGGTVATAG
jgi:hypothetical protein